MRLRLDFDGSHGVEHRDVLVVEVLPAPVFDMRGVVQKSRPRSLLRPLAPLSVRMNEDGKLRA